MIGLACRLLWTALAAMCAVLSGIAFAPDFHWERHVPPRVLTPGSSIATVSPQDFIRLSNFISVENTGGWIHVHWDAPVAAVPYGGDVLVLMPDGTYGAAPHPDDSIYVGTRPRRCTPFHISVPLQWCGLSIRAGTPFFPSMWNIGGVYIDERQYDLSVSGWLLAVVASLIAVFGPHGVVRFFWGRLVADPRPTFEVVPLAGGGPRRGHGP